MHTALQSQKAVTAYLRNPQLLPFASIAEQHSWIGQTCCAVDYGFIFSLAASPIQFFHLIILLIYCLYQKSRSVMSALSPNSYSTQ